MCVVVSLLYRLLPFLRCLLALIVDAKLQNEADLLYRRWFDLHRVELVART